MTARDVDAYNQAYGLEPEEPTTAGVSVLSAINDVYEPESPR